VLSVPSSAFSLQPSAFNIMRQLRLTIWHLGLVIAIVVGAVIGVLAGAQALLPRWERRGYCHWWRSWPSMAC
jgi:hypothetical protein